jgi:hypothetical protein
MGWKCMSEVKHKERLFMNLLLSDHVDVWEGGLDDLKGTGSDDVNWIKVAQNRVQWKS